MTAASSAAARRPIILIPARFSATSSALRYQAVVGARALMEAVYAAGGEPLLSLPVAPDGVADEAEVARRLLLADGVLLPGGGDLAPQWTGQSAHSSLYDIDLEQDAYDLAIAKLALSQRLPLLAICRGLQVLNTELGGELIQDLDQSVEHHRHRRHQVRAEPDSDLAALVGSCALDVCCYHHQAIGRLGAGLRVVASAADGVIEAVELPAHAGWFLGVQWHPEDTAATDSRQAALFEGLVCAAALTPS